MIPHSGRIPVPLLLTAVFLAPVVLAQGAKEYTNSIGMRLARIPRGDFVMGFTGSPLPIATAGLAFRTKGDFDEYPAHRVRISKAFDMGAFEVTNAQYE